MGRECSVSELCEFGKTFKQSPRAAHNLALEVEHDMERTSLSITETEKLSNKLPSPPH